MITSDGRDKYYILKTTATVDAPLLETSGRSKRGEQARTESLGGDRGVKRDVSGKKGDARGDRDCSESVSVWGSSPSFRGVSALSRGGDRGSNPLGDAILFSIAPVGHALKMRGFTGFSTVWLVW